MKYSSTRGGVKGLSFEEALCSGFVSDGGILLPDVIPTISITKLKDLGKKSPSYRSLASYIITLFTEDELSHKDLEDILDKAYSSFGSPEMIPIKHLLSNNVNIAEMFYGKSWSFKDYGMFVVGQLLEYFLSRSKKHQTLLIATSGDTGSSAVSAVRGMKCLDAIVFLPRAKCSKLQELQMTTVIDDNVHIFRADGVSDDMDILFGNIYADVDFVNKYNISTLNSVNWGRIMCQIIHYFYIYLQMEPDCCHDVEVVIPTGGCGHITAGCIARRMGLPIRLVGAVNENDTFDRMVKTGQFSVNPTISTISPSMDIQMPYNAERVWSLVTNGDAKIVNQLMQEFTSESKTHLPEDLLNEIKKHIGSFSAKQDDVKAAMKRCYDENNYIICPHTAVAMAYHYAELLREQKSEMLRKRVIIATASAEKFPEALKSAGIPVITSESVNKLYEMPTHFTDLEKEDDWLKILTERILQIEEKIQKNTKN